MSATLDDVKVTQQHASRPPPNALGINVEKPKFPQYAIYSKRMESFDLWPEHLPVQKKDMVEAGLKYTGVGDSVRCYFCGGGLRNWKVGDVPMDEHAKWYPKCPHILLVKGQAYIDRIARGEKPEIDGEEGTAIKQDSVDSVNHLETAAAQSCIQMDYSREMVAKAIQIFIAKNGNRDYKGKDLCKILFDIEENPEQLIMNISDTNAVDKCVNETNDVVKEEETLGVGDRARYPFSGGGLENRKKDGIPKEQRNIWYPKYPYILLLKGQSYDAKLTFQRKLEAVDPSEHMGGAISEINRLGSIADQKCLEMDFPVDKVKQAIDIYCQRNGDLNFKAKDLCEMLFEIEESQDKTYTAVIDVTATTVPVASFGYEDFPVLYNSFIEENQMSKMCMYKQDHMTLLAYHHLVSCPQCATEISISQAI